ncbi:MAG: 2-dehydropantoate 2-reductase [Planctomycetota bacterium]
MSRSYAIIGAGALGCYYGSRLEKAGCAVHYLMRSDYPYVSKHGLRVESMHGEVVLNTPSVYDDMAALPPCDVALVTMKSTSNAALPALLPPALKDDGVVLVLQNGLGVERQAAGIVGEERVIGGLCFLCSNRIGPGHVRQTRVDRLMLGEFATRGVSPRMRTIGADFERGQVTVSLSEDIGLARWQKLVWNVPYNGLCAVLDADTTMIMSNPATASLVVDLMHEVTSAAEAVGGYRIGESFVQKMLDDTAGMDAYQPSMLIDRREGRPMEVEAIHGEPVRSAEAAGYPVPKMRMLYEQLCLVDRLCD